MNPVLIGQLLGVSFACGLNLYATVAAAGILSRVGLIHELPPALTGLESPVVIGTALVLFLVEAIIDRVRNADSIWDAVHTFIRPPAAALLAIGAVWAQPLAIQIGAAGLAFTIALATHGAKAGFRVALNTTRRNGKTHVISTLEDMLAVGFVFAALVYPVAAMAAGAVALAILVLFGPRLWRAFALGLRCLAAWFRTLFVKAGWRGAEQLPGRLRGALDDPPLGSAPHRAIRAAVNGLPGTGAYRNGWLVMTHDGPRFVFGGWITARNLALPEATQVESTSGLWINALELESENGAPVSLYLLKDGPPLDTVVEEFRAVHA